MALLYLHPPSGLNRETRENSETPNPSPSYYLFCGVVRGSASVRVVRGFKNGVGCVIISFDLRDQISAVFYGKFIYSAIHTYNQELRDNVSQPF